MKKFKDFCEEIDVDKIKSNPSFKIKESFSNSINDFLTWIKDQSQGLNFDKIKNKVLGFKNEIEDSSEDIENLIQDKSTLAQYNKLLSSSLAQIEQFEDPPSDISSLLTDLESSLNSLYAFIQSKITV